MDGEPVPGTFAAEDELFGIGRAMGEVGRGGVRARPAGRIGEDLDSADPFNEIDWMRRLGGEIGLPGVASRSCSSTPAPDALARADGRCPSRPRRRRQTSGRRSPPGPSACCIGFQTHHVFGKRPTFMAPVATCPLDELVAALAEPGAKRAILGEDDAPAGPERPLRRHRRCSCR